jgi:cytochrome b6-f complex iron-sulfur subunit
MNTPEETTQQSASRRTVVTAVGAAAIGTLTIGTLAACGSGSGGEDGGTGSGAGSTGAGSAPAAAGALTALSAVPVGGAVVVQDSSGKPVVVAQPTAGTVIGFSGACTHAGCAVQANGAELDCPCHLSKFNALTGAVLNGPAASPLPSVPVKVSGANVIAG